MKMLDIESLDTLIIAVRKYKETLAVNRQILVNAADVCDQAMGSDAISKRHISKLHEALQELQKTSRIVEDVAEALLKDRALAIETLEG